MQYITPTYYDEFRCIGGECPHTCCGGWQIMIDEDTLEHYRQMPGADGEWIRQQVNWEEGCFNQKDGRCACLDDDGLCRILLRTGNESDWCHTCRTYPRHIEEFEGVREISLGLSCPEAARIILERTEPVTFEMREDDEPDEEYEDFDYLLYTKLVDARRELIALAQDRRRPVELRLALVWEYGDRLQAQYDRGEVFLMDDTIEELRGRLGDGDGVSGNAGRPVDITPDECDAGRSVDAGAVVDITPERVTLEAWRETAGMRWEMERDIVGEMEVLFPEWEEVFGRLAGQVDITLGSEKPGLSPDKLEVCLEQILVYMIFGYFCGAVYDGMIAAKARMAVLTVEVIGNLYAAHCREAGGGDDDEKSSGDADCAEGGDDDEKCPGDADCAEGGGRAMRDFERLAAGFCRELEHSDENLIFVQESLSPPIFE